jgi:Amt family ammonium transporter
MATNVTDLAVRVASIEADLATTKADYAESLDTIWMLVAGLLVFFMHSGFSLLESGCVRLKNTQNILAKNLLVLSVGFLCWWTFGWGLAYGVEDEGNKVLGTSQMFAIGFMDDKTLFRNWFFQGAFCATGGTIVSGAMAERTKLTGFGIYIVAMTTIIYPLIAHWGWSGSGLLAYTDDAGESVSIVGPAYMDFAGSGLVHLTGGMGAIWGSIFVGARKGRFDPAVDQGEFDAHNVPFCVIGTIFLWFGWYGFNPGSTLSMHDAETAYTAAIVAVNTTLAPCVGGLVVFGLRAFVVEPKLLDVGGFCNGILAGLVSITAGCAAVKSWEAIVIGFIGGLVYQGASMALKRLKVDDVVDAFPVHGACGIWGTIVLGIFGNPDEGMGGNGLLYGGDQIGTQIVGVLLIAIWVSLLSTAIFLPLKLLGQLRLSDEFQDAGADIMEHSPKKAYIHTGNVNASNQHEDHI